VTVFVIGGDVFCTGLGGFVIEFTGFFILDREVYKLHKFRQANFYRGIMNTDSRGFSILELLFTILIIGILSSILTKSFGLYKEKAQHSSAMTLFGQARTALEGGKIASENFPDQVMMVEQTGPGSPGGEFGQLLLQGIVLPDNMRVFLRHTPNCENDLCVEDLLTVRHCQTKRMATLTQFRSGAYTMNLSAEAAEPCDG
jgi:prepilin-type N-terminal cleavage/methylation domain-containing protein